MEYKLMLNLKLGDRVWSILSGWGVVVEIEDSEHTKFPICADFNGTIK